MPLMPFKQISWVVQDPFNEMHVQFRVPVFQAFELAVQEVINRRPQQKTLHDIINKLFLNRTSKKNVSSAAQK